MYCGASLGPHFSPHSTAKPMVKSLFSGRMVSSGISDVVIAPVHFEKFHLKKLMMRIMIIVITRIKHLRGECCYVI